jgi:glutaredoxin
MTVQRLILYGKADCHLCHEARDMLVRLQAEYPFNLEEVDITADPQLEGRYRHMIPVVVIDSALELDAPIRESELRAALKR